MKTAVCTLLALGLLATLNLARAAGPDDDEMMMPGMGGGQMGMGPAGPMMGYGQPAPNPATSRGAALVQQYCSQCHQAPAPGREPPQAWPGILRHMQQYMKQGGPDVRQPSADEIRQIAGYLEGRPWH